MRIAPVCDRTMSASTDQGVKISLSWVREAAAVGGRGKGCIGWVMSCYSTCMARCLEIGGMEVMMRHTCRWVHMHSRLLLVFVLGTEGDERGPASASQ